MNANRYVAFIDILGFKQMVNNSKDNITRLGNEMSDIYLRSIWSALTGDGATVPTEQDLKNCFEKTGIGVYQFSDSVIFYTKGDSNQDLEKMIRCLNLLFAQALNRGYPLRGGLSYGNLFVNDPIIVGDGLVKAAELEKIQAWSGMIIDSDCFKDNWKEQMMSNKLIDFENVPLKNLCGIDYEKHEVLNWPNFIGQRVSSASEVIKYFLQNIGPPKSTADKIKLKETIRFFRKNLGYEALPPFVFDETQRVQLISVKINHNHG